VPVKSPSHHELTSCWLRNQPPDTLADAFDKTARALLFSTPKRLRDHPSDAVKEPVAQFLASNFDSTAEIRHFLDWSDGIVVVQPRHVSETLGKAEAKVHGRLDTCGNDTADAATGAHCGPDAHSHRRRVSARERLPQLAARRPSSGAFSGASLL